MSHKVTGKFEFDADKIKHLKAAVDSRTDCHWLGQGMYALYSESVQGEGFKINSWKYPCVVADGHIQYDNFNGHWGKQSVLDEIVQDAVANMTAEAAIMSGFQEYSRETNSEGELVLTLYRE